MTTRSRRLRAVVLLVLGGGFAGCGGEGGGGAGALSADAAALRADLTGPGPYPVGVRNVPLTDLNRPDDAPSRGPRFVNTEVWYPAAESARGGRTSSLADYLPPSLRALGVLAGLVTDLEIPGVRDAPVAATGGPFAVIDFSHGNTGLRVQNYTMAAHLASHGFVVFAPDHIGNAVFAQRADGSTVFFESAYRAETLADRVADMRFLMDQMEGFARPGSGSFLAGRMDTDRGFGISGHSFGGLTSIVTADQDARVVAVMPLAASNLEGIPLPPLLEPSLIAIATEDKTIGEEGNALDRALYEASTGRRVLAEFVNGGHFTFSDACALALGLFGNNDGCGQGQRYATGESFPFILDDEFWRLMNPMATAFFRWTLDGDERMRAVLRANPDPNEILYQSDRL